MKRVLSGAAVLLTAIGLAGCASGAEENPASPDEVTACEPAMEFDTVTDGVLTIAGINAVPKFFARTADGPFEGFDGELIQIFAEQNCLELEVKPLAPPAAILDMQDGKSDFLVGGILKSPARGEQFGQTSVDLTYETMGILSTEGFSSLEELEGKNIGLVAGSSYIAPAEERFGTANLSEFQSEANAVSDLKAGRIDAVLTTSMSGWYQTTINEGLQSHVVAEDPDEEVMTGVSATGWLFAKEGADELGAAADAFFTQIHEDGTLKTVLENQNLDNIEFYLNGTR